MLPIFFLLVSSNAFFFFFIQCVIKADEGLFQEWNLTRQAKACVLLQDLLSAHKLLLLPH